MVFSWLALIPVSVGGALGACARFLLSSWIQQKLLFDHQGNQKYWLDLAWLSILPILIVNVLGSFIMGFLSMYILQSIAISKETIFGLSVNHFRLLFGIGFLGSFTTVSSFALETVLLFQTEQYLLFFANVFLTLMLSLGGCLLGMIAFQKFFI